MGIRIQPWTEADFLSRRSEYTDLLKRSCSDPLFQSWEWLSSWWAVHKSAFDLKLEGYAAIDKDGGLKGIALTTRRFVRHRCGIAGQRIEPLGNLWRESGTAITEHMTFPVERGLEQPVSELLWEHILLTTGWTDLCLCYCPQDSETWKAFVGISQTVGGAYTRANELVPSYCIDIRDGFDVYLQRLGAGTRRRLYGGREKLKRLGSFSFVDYRFPRIGEGITTLDMLYRQRWTVPLFSGFSGAQYSRLMKAGEIDDSILLARMEFEGEPVASVMDIRVGNRQYNLLSAFSWSGAKSISPGLLLLGRQIEQACDQNVSNYDLLAGYGKQTNYKEKLGGDKAVHVSIHLVRSKMLEAVYRSYDGLRAISPWH